MSQASFSTPRRTLDAVVVDSESQQQQQQQQQQSQRRKRHYSMSEKKKTCAVLAATLAVLSVSSSPPSSVSAFQPSVPFPFGNRSQQQHSNTRRWVATDPEILLSDPYLRQKLQQSLASAKKKKQKKQQQQQQSDDAGSTSMYLKDEIFRSEKESLASLYYSSPDYDGFYQEEVMYQEEVVKSPVTKKLRKKKSAHQTQTQKQQPRLKKTAMAAVSKAKAASLKRQSSSTASATSVSTKKTAVKKSKKTKRATSVSNTMDTTTTITPPPPPPRQQRKPQFKTTTKRKPKTTRTATTTLPKRSSTKSLLNEKTSCTTSPTSSSSTTKKTSTTRKITTTTTVAAESSSSSKPPTNKKSTMPGFSTRHLTGRQKAFQDGIKLVEARSGKTYKENPHAKETRRKKNSETMYKSSASVPDSLVQFASEIHKEDRITPTEEVELGTKTQEAIRLQSLHDNLVETLDREPTNEEWCAAAGKINFESLEQALEEGLEAKNKLVTSNLRMVQGVVNIYIRNGLGGQYNAGDMMQEGTMALIRAAEKFEPDRGFRFSTYAMYWIRAAVKRSQIFQSRVVSVPQRLHENHKRILRVEKELKHSLGGRDPTRKELGEAVNMSEQQIERCMKAMKQRIFSLDQEIQNTKQPNNGDANKDTMYELIDNKSSDDGEYNKIQRLFMRQDLIETLYRHLSPLDVDLLLLRFGLMDERTLPHGFGGPLTIAEVSRLVGLKPDKVRRMINNSLSQLKFLIANEWGDFERDLESLE